MQRSAGGLVFSESNRKSAPSADPPKSPPAPRADLGGRRCGMGRLGRREWYGGSGGFMDWADGAFSGVIATVNTKHHPSPWCHLAAAWYLCTR